MPEEINRVLTDAVADNLFITERSTFANLQREGVPNNTIFFVGNVMVDSLQRHLSTAEALDMPRQYGLLRQGYALLTLHRPSNVDVPAVLGGIVESIASLQAAIPVLFPVHPRTWQRLSEAGFLEQIASMANLQILEPLGYLEFLRLMAQARLMLTDSGGIEEETTVFRYHA